MAERFAPDFQAADAVTPVYDKGTYQIKLNDVYPFMYERESDGRIIAGVRYSAEMAGKFGAKGKLETDGLEGRRVASPRFYIHSEGAWGMTKLALMAAMGYSRDEEGEKAANEEFFSQHDFGLDGDPGADAEDLNLGDGWEAPLGRFVNVELDIRVGDDGGKYQEFNNWSPAE